MVELRGRKVVDGRMPVWRGVWKIKEACIVEGFGWLPEVATAAATVWV